MAQRFNIEDLFLTPYGISIDEAIERALAHIDYVQASSGVDGVALFKRLRVELCGRIAELDDNPEV